MNLNFTLKNGLFVAACLISMGAYSQNKPILKTKKFGKTVSSSVYCGSTEYEALLEKKKLKRSTANFEKWIAPKVAIAKTKRLQKNGQGTNEVVTIPVVFHIIHNGSPIGTAENIADAQVISQITVLNEDFRRLEGSNGANTNPVGADSEINFCLAKRDPFGVLSNGITRHALGNGQGWSMEEIEVIKAQTQWDPEKYLNIWVFDIIQGLAGYAQFPQESGLEGLDGGSVSETANTDGVALAHDYVGSEEIYPQGEYAPDKNLGRTASHEVGHFFGLRHIWGDLGSCDATDYCDDTPAALMYNQGCPGGNFDSCPDNIGIDMIQNYMDYTNDACQNIFTLNQKDRMQAVLANSPRRHSLITSDGCTPGMVYDNDGSLNINGVNGECGVTDIAPGVTLTNSGNNTLTSITFSYKLDEGEEETYDWTGSLTTGQSAVVTLPEITTTAGSHTFSANILTVNGGEDQAPSNDDKTITFKLTGTYVTNKIIVTIQTDDYGDETYWILGNYESDEVLGGNIDPETGQPLQIYESNQLYTFTLNVNEDGCYLFAMLDAGQDGMCCMNGNGYYKIETAEGVLITEGGSFTMADQRFFALDFTAGNKDIIKSGDIKLYPNPAKNILNISVADAINMPENYTVYNSLGQLMDSGNVTTTTQSIDIARYASGIYFVKLSKGDTNTTLQFIKQ
ncbi:Pregnancy-associated plasma protein-A [compost metagenome]